MDEEFYQTRILRLVFAQDPEPVVLITVSTKKYSAYYEKRFLSRYMTCKDLTEFSASRFCVRYTDSTNCYKSRKWHIPAIFRCIDVTSSWRWRCFLFKSSASALRARAANSSVRHKVVWYQNAVPFCRPYSFVGLFEHDTSFLAAH